MKVLRCAKFAFPFEVAPLQAEVAALEAGWKPHFQTSHYDGEWNVLPLRAVKGAQNDALPFSLGDEPAEYEATPLLSRCPAIARLLDSLHCPVQAARLLNLRRGSVIKTHRDAELAFEMGHARLHVPIFTNPEVEFYIDEERVVMAPGTLWYINANLPHRVANHGETNRIHLVVDCLVNDWLRELFAGAEAYHSNIRRDPREVGQMIELLRQMRNPAADAMVAQLEAEIANAR